MVEFCVPIDGFCPTIVVESTKLQADFAAAWNAAQVYRGMGVEGENSRDNRKVRANLRRFSELFQIHAFSCARSAGVFPA